jgi:hypothetical protein
MGKRYCWVVSGFGGLHTVDMVKLIPYDRALSFHLGYVLGILQLAAGVTVGTGRENDAGTTMYIVTEW